MTRKERKVFLQLPNPLEWVIIQDFMFDVIVYNWAPFTELEKEKYTHTNIVALYKILLFDIWACIYWFRRHQVDLQKCRL